MISNGVFNLLIVYNALFSALLLQYSLKYNLKKKTRNGTRCASRGRLLKTLHRSFFIFLFNRLYPPAVYFARMCANEFNNVFNC